MSPRVKIRSGATDHDPEVDERAARAVADLLTTVLEYRRTPTVESAKCLTDVADRLDQFVRTHRNQAIADRNENLRRQIGMLTMYLHATDGSDKTRGWSFTRAGYSGRAQHEKVFAEDMAEEFPHFGDRLWTPEAKKLLIATGDYKKAACARLGEALDPPLKWRQVYTIAFGEDDKPATLERDAWNALRVAAEALDLPVEGLDKAIPEVLDLLLEHLRSEGLLEEACYKMVGGQHECRWKGLPGNPAAEAISSLATYMNVWLYFKAAYVKGTDLKKQ